MWGLRGAQALQRFLLLYFGWLAGLIGLISSWLSGWSIIDFWLKTQTDLSLWVNLYVLSLTFAVLVAFAFRQFQSSRKERYANITAQIHQVIHSVRDIETYMDERAPQATDTEAVKKFTEHVRGMLEEPLEFVATIFQSLTSTSCRASLKMIYEYDGNAYFYTLARDRGSAQRCRQRDEQRLASNHDAISNNSHLALICDKDHEVWHFISNDLSGVKDLKTTSAAAYNKHYDKEVRHPKPLDFLFYKWPLPYRSCMVGAVRQGPVRDMERTTEIVGFLQVDSEARGVFKERWDVQLLFAVADAMYRPLKRLNDLQRRAAGVGAAASEAALASATTAPKRGRSRSVQQ